MKTQETYDRQEELTSRANKLLAGDRCVTRAYVAAAIAAGLDPENLEPIFKDGGKRWVLKGL